MHVLFPLFNKSEAKKIVESVFYHLTNRINNNDSKSAKKYGLDIWLLPSESGNRLILLANDSPVLARQIKNVRNEEKKSEEKTSAASMCRMQ